MGWRSIRAAGLGALLALLCCGGLDTFVVTEKASAVIPGASLFEQLAGDFGFGDFLDMDLSQNQELKNQGVEKGQLDSVRLISLALTVVEPASGQDFGFLEELRFYVETEGLPRLLIASGGPFPAGASRVELNLADVDMEPYATAPAMKVTTEATGRRPRQQTTIEAELQLEVDVDVSGVACGG
jgi:hypothetical protein